ncbi:MAG: heavy-metal-associated domain-containing protein [Prevotella sp.]|nr:heavy-metal-associated domain-containing protein [Prevotella sp.]
MKRLVLVAALMVSVTAGFAKKQKVVFTTQPQMHCANCENRIKTNLRFEKGVKLIETSVEEQKVTVTYDDSKTSPEKLISGFKKFGYEARVLKPGAKVAKEAHECASMKK